MATNKLTNANFRGSVRVEVPGCANTCVCVSKGDSGDKTTRRAQHTQCRVTADPTHTHTQMLRVEMPADDGVHQVKCRPECPHKQNGIKNVCGLVFVTSCPADRRAARGV